MTYMRSWKSHRLTSHTWLGLNPHIGRPLSRIVGAIGLFFFMKVDKNFQKYDKKKICPTNFQNKIKNSKKMNLFNINFFL
jgi:hypothetical protein